MQAQQVINVAITGTLAEPRKKIAEYINSTSNAKYTESVTFETHYLVCAKTDSKKARRAARLGTAVISEAELRVYLDRGSFPSTGLPEKPVHYPNNFPEIEWSSESADPEIWVMGYTDARGHSSIRSVAITGFGCTVGQQATQWVGGYDGEHFKTWRRDRIDFLVKPRDLQDEV